MYNIKITKKISEVSKHFDKIRNFTKYGKINNKKIL